MTPEELKEWGEREEKEKEELKAMLVKTFLIGNLWMPPQPKCTDGCHYLRDDGVCAFMSAKTHRTFTPKSDAEACPNANFNGYYFSFTNWECSECGELFHALSREELKIEAIHQRRCPSCLGHNTLRTVHIPDRLWQNIWIASKDLRRKKKIDNPNDGNVERKCISIEHPEKGAKKLREIDPQGFNGFTGPDKPISPESWEVKE